MYLCVFFHSLITFTFMWFVFVFALFGTESCFKYLIPDFGNLYSCFTQILELRNLSSSTRNYIAALSSSNDLETAQW